MSTKTNGDSTSKPFLDQAARDMAFAKVRGMLDMPRERNGKTYDYSDVPDWQVVRFIDICERVKLDPNIGQIWAIPPYKGGELMAMTGLASKLIVASRTGQFDGFERIEWCGKDGVWLDVWIPADNPAAARAIGWRKDRRFPSTFVAKFDEFVGAHGDFWKKMDSHMIAKCAKNGAINELFPDLLSDLFAEEELGAISHGEPWSPEKEQANFEQRAEASREAADRLAKAGVGTQVETTKEPDLQESKAATEPIESHREDFVSNRDAPFVEAATKPTRTTKPKKDKLPALDGAGEAPNPDHILQVAAEAYLNKPLFSIPFERFRLIIRYAKKIDNAVQAGAVVDDFVLEDAKQIKLRYNQLLKEDPSRKPYDLSDLELVS